ncbi:DUF6188 family protein [Streptomyces sp. NBC_01718]
MASKAGSLHGGLRLDCRAEPSFEAWQMVGPGGWRFVSMPGGDLAV